VTSSTPRPLSDGLDAVVRSLQGVDAPTLRGVFDGWADAVGPVIAAHVNPLKLDGAVLLVEVDEPAWATQMRFLDHDVRERLQAATGAQVERIEVRVAGRRSGRSGARSGGRDRIG
jgi:predicted nucleic acid-binding Zn ribbon protein